MRLGSLMRAAKKAAAAAAKDDFDPHKWRWHFSGMCWKDLRHHYSIIPIYILTVLCLGMSGSYVIRLATKHPEVTWTKQNPEPWNEYANKQYKFVNVGRDYSKGCGIPSYED